MKPKKRLDANELWDYALRSAGARAQTAAELRAKLAARAERAEDIEATIGKLKEYNFVDDHRFAEQYAAARLENQGFGKQRALRDLRLRRVAPITAEKAVEQIYAKSDETELIEEYIRKKYRKADRETLFEQPKDLASAFRRLRLAGFQTALIVKVLKRFAANPELLDGMEDITAEDE